MKFLKALLGILLLCGIVQSAVVGIDFSSQNIKVALVKPGTLFRKIPLPPSPRSIPSHIPIPYPSLDPPTPIHTHIHLLSPSSHCLLIDKVGAHT